MKASKASSARVAHAARAAPVARPRPTPSAAKAARKEQAAPAEPAADTDAPDDLPSVMASVAEPIARHPDGWYWTAPDGRKQFGPFSSYEDAFADMHGGDPDDLEPGESLREAEAELGIADWIDPDTGAPAEGMGHPHLQE